MSSSGVINFLVFLLYLHFPEESGVRAQAVTPGSPYPSDPYCDYFCILKGKENGANDMDPYPIQCLELGPNGQNAGTGCDTTLRHFCPPECTQCDKRGQLWCPPLTQSRAAQPPPPPKSANHDECRKHCENLYFLEGDVTFDSGEYTVSCGEGYLQHNTQCGICTECEGPLYQNPFCVNRQGDGIDDEYGLKCPPLPRSLFPDGCSNFCGEEAWLRGMRTPAEVDKPFTVSCGHGPDETWGQRCGVGCPWECHGFCPRDGNLYCPAGVEPQLRTTTTTITTTTSTTTQKPDGPGDSKEEEKNAWLMYSMIPLGVLSFCCSVALCGFRCYRRCNRGRRVGAVAGGLGLLQPQQQILQPQPMMALPQQQQMDASFPAEEAPAADPVPP